MPTRGIPTSGNTAPCRTSGKARGAAKGGARNVVTPLVGVTGRGVATNQAIQAFVILALIIL